ncbi:phosphate ABC transporter permease PstA [Bacillus sp. S/N-304-OC-R1]|uniref:phosphate ABC transporter permease PstA n=1 Tax=Bacillus sp. S/N-304-OC-R1 TaxID=2758034 RepID=UPI001C8F02F2|nr:phosphate ABC transporter permease PstA [Bacillus sp. S/N-304-OC-R1]MBY0122888.1 phosphate ABC transporter permease PstA [Bacillus sp. S/N-304-OC-R1]
MSELTFKYSKRKQTKNIILNKFFTILLWTIVCLVLAVIGLLLFRILSKGLSGISLSFLIGLPSEIESGGGIGPFLFNSLYVLIIAMVISIPIGIGSGIYLAEYAPDNRLTEFIRTCVEGLASVPSIVFGLFGYVLFVDVFQIGLTIIGAAVALSLLNLPILTRVTEEAIQAVPDELREASYALGATKSATIIKVVIPAAISGILTGISLASCRAFGESAVILLVGGTSSSGEMWDLNLFSQGGTLPVHLWYVQSEALVEDAREIADKSAAVLVIMILILSSFIRIPIWLKNK